MEEKYQLICDLIPGRYNTILKLSVARMWERPEGFQKALDLIFHDEENCRIQGTIHPNSGVPDAVRSVFKEGRSFVVKNISIGENNSRYRSCDHKYRINFTRMSTVREITDDALSEKRFKFKSFEEMDQGTESVPPFDVIAQLIERGDLRRVRSRNYKGDNNETSLLELTLQNKSGLTKKCALWGEHAVEVNDSLQDCNVQPVVIIVILARLTKFSDQLRLTTCKYGTKVLLNPDLPEASDFKERLTKGTSLVQSIAKIQSPKLTSPEDEFINILPRKRIVDILSLTETGQYFSVLAKILCVADLYEWKYHSCPKCKKKADETKLGKYCCPYCNCEVLPVLRFRVEVKVVDKTESATFVLWDDIVTQLTGFTVQKVLERSAMTTMDDLVPSIYTFPSDCFQNVFGKPMLFKLKIKESTYTYSTAKFSVSSICTDPEIISNYKSTLLDQESCFPGIYFG